MSVSQSNVYLLLLILATIVSIALAVTTWRRRPGPAIIPFVSLMTG